MYSMAGIIKRNNKWVAVFRTLDGKEIRKTTRVDVVPKVIPPGVNKRALLSQNEARARLIAEELENGYKTGFVDSNRLKAIAGGDIQSFSLGRKVVSVGAYLKEWLQSRSGKIQAYERDRKAIQQFISFLGNDGGQSISSVNKNVVREFSEVEMERVSSGTISRYLESLSCAFNQAVEKELISSNPFRGARLDKKKKQADKQERGAFTVEEVKRLVEILPDEWPDMIRVCLYTGGQRLGDIATLKWDQVNLEGGLISMTTQKTKRRMNKPIIGPLKEILKEREKYSINEFVFPLAAMKHAQAGGKSSKLSLEFTGLLKKHGIISSDGMKAKGDKRVLSEKSFHSLRATAVTILRLAGVPADLCRFIVGHDSEEIERVYFRPDSQDVVHAMEEISSKIIL